MFCGYVCSVTRSKGLSSILMNFYFVALYFPLANGLIVEVKVVIELNRTQTIVYHVDCSDVFGGKAC